MEETTEQIVNRLVSDGKGRPLSVEAATDKQRRYWHLISIKDWRGNQIWTYEEAAQLAADGMGKVCGHQYRCECHKAEGEQV